jgi:D-3-phosphoglycerate dehydrogenase
MMPLLMLVGERPNPWARKILDASWESYSMGYVDHDTLQQFDAVWCGMGQRIPAGPLDGPYRCQVVACPMTGTEHIDHAALAAAGITVLSLAGEGDFLRTIHATAEHTLCLMLAALRRLPQAVAQRPRYERAELLGGELHGRTVGIVGVGRIGRMVAGYCKAFGCRVLGWDCGHVPDSIERVADLDDLLLESDIVSLHLPLTGHTRGLIDMDRLRMMRRGSLLVNTARGALIDEVALLHVLQHGPLAMAALDVLAGEPEITAETPLVGYAAAANNLLLTPHIGGNTAESREATDCWMANKLTGWWSERQCASSA